MRWLPALALSWGLLTGTAPPQERPSITVAAAISLTDALTAAAAEYKSVGGGPVRLNFGASNVLARQIAAGAPVDVFISADEAQMDVVAAAGSIVEGTRVNLLTNVLAIVVPNDRPRTFTGLRDLLAPEFRRIAIGDPAAVPAGVYAKQYLEREGLWTLLQPRIVPSGSVRAALVAVESGAADAAIVYRTDARTARRASLAWTVPADRGPRIVYPAAVIRGAGERAGARHFLNFLMSDPGMRILERFGFARGPQDR